MGWFSSEPKVDKSQLAYNSNAQLAAMREDIASRSRNLDLMQNVISIGTAVVGGGLALLVGGPVALIGGLGLAVGGPLITTMVIKKKQEELELDRKYLEEQLHGGGLGEQWAGYRRYVMDQGGAPPSGPAMYAAGQGAARDNGRK